MRPFTRSALVAVAVAATAALGQPAPAAQASSGGISAGGYTVSGDEATFPLRQGRTTDGRSFSYIVIEASDSETAQRFGVRVVNKLQNAANTMAVQRGVIQTDGLLRTPGSVDFTPERSVSGTPGTGFPPAAAVPGSEGRGGYSPLVQLPDGGVINAPVVANGTGTHDKVVALSGSAVTLRLTHGFARGNAVRYLSTDASEPDVAALEGSTLAEPLRTAPGRGDDSSHSSRAALAAFVNGPTGAVNPQRQGLNSALLDEGDPLNVLAWLPGQGRYSPLWDVHLTEWAPGETPMRVTEVAEVEDLAEARQVVGPGGSPWAASGPVVNCPILALG